ncbi:hypothetical protein [Aliarcobacter vitoriensis]|uniref:TonB C-terminal domain-containing protein n=1 Tax=Aliarcobacter vitoriensis TaxID=2011099 RepID=A0A366MQF2_9BACT|nr:hypothetical protein [Aliarcobacter vitoriensis]RBQ28511.1 hypothetical protein CRU91_09125 [Aliarcobacter vitoriensis]
MKRRTKNFIEDAIIVIIVLFAIYLLYFFIFSKNNDSDTLETTNTTENTVLSTNSTETEKSFLLSVYEDLKEKLFEEEEQKETIVTQNQDLEKVENKFEDNQTNIHLQRAENRIQHLNQNDEENSQTNDVIETDNFDKNEEQKTEQVENKTENVIQPSTTQQTINNTQEEVTQTKPLIEIKTDENNDDNDTNHSVSIRDIDLFFQDFERKVNSNIEKNIDKSTLQKGEFVNIRVTILKDGRYEQLTFVDGNQDYFNKIRNSIDQVFPLNIDDSLKINFPRYYRMKIEF